MKIDRRTAAKFLASGVPILGNAEANRQTSGMSDSHDLYDVRVFGATGDGKTIDTPAINKAIDRAAAAGGGRVHFPAGTYVSFSIHLKSNVTLQLETGTKIVAADSPAAGTNAAGYDPAEPNKPWEDYQDFGHNHWHNSLIWGENLEHVAIVGPGLIWGKGLSRGTRKLREPNSPAQEINRLP